MKRLPATLVAALVVASALASAARPDAGLVSLTPAVRRGGVASMVVHVATTSPCTIRVHYASRKPLAAPGLSPRVPLFSVVRWSWTMPRTATRGRWSVDVRCGAGATVHGTFLVK